VLRDPVSQAAPITAPLRAISQLMREKSNGHVRGDLLLYFVVYYARSDFDV
jgi:hypothetical protein